METVHQCLGTAEMNTWLKARKAAGRVAGMHIRMYKPSFLVKDFQVWALNFGMTQKRGDIT